MPAPTFLAAGPDAIEKTAYLLSHAQPLVTQDQFGTPVSVQPGTLWAGHRMFIGTGYEGVYFVAEDRLYSQSTADFVRDTYLIAFGEGAARAAWMLPIARAEMAVVMAFTGAAAGALGIVAGVTVFLTKVTVFYSANKAEIEKVSEHLRPVISGLNYFRTTCPKLFSLLSKAVGEQLVAAAGEGISSVDVAVFLAAILGGLVKADAAANITATTLRLSLRALTKIATITLVVTAVKRSPGAVVNGAQPQAAQVVRELQSRGIMISEQEVLTVAAEACACNPVHRKKLEELLKGSESASPMLEQLAERLKQVGI
ncbi:MAG: hypothetical protein H7Y20_18910 [Bryobacteraceae bacterium]|nr:hypothetical protein [Bryobacteraceae bacterium]